MNKKILFLCTGTSLMLCFSQILGNRVLILACLIVFAGIVCYGCIKNYTLPVLMFFLPWTALLRFSPDSVSAYTLALVLTGLISVVKNKFSMKSYYVGISLLVFTITLLSKILSWYQPEKSYLMFIAMLALYPTMNFDERRFDFYSLCVFFSSGIIIAALTAQRFSVYPNIAKFIKIDSYLNITRKCGYYGDPNFYSAHITAALAGCLILMVREKRRYSQLILTILFILLIYCGLLSGSKSFVIITGIVIGLWVADVLTSHGKIKRKFGLLIGLAVFLIFILVTSVFRDLLDVVFTRFSWADDASSLTTGRTDLWKLYITDIISNIKLLLLGQGYTNVILGYHASHNSLLQLVYQFGLAGSGFIIAWIAGLYQDIVRPHPAMKKKRYLCVCTLVAGAFIPWLAIDILFFDELFLVTTYVFIGIDEICNVFIDFESAKHEKIDVRLIYRVTHVIKTCDREKRRENEKRYLSIQ